MLAPTREAAAELNVRAQAYARHAGRLGDQALELGGVRYSDGDRVICLRNRERDVGVLNGQRGTVTALEPDTPLSLRVDIDGQGERVLPASYIEDGHLALGYAMTVHKSQGMTADRTYVLGSEDQYRELGYTALSRHRDECRFYVNAGEPQPEPAQLARARARARTLWRSPRRGAPAPRAHPRAQPGRVDGARRPRERPGPAPALERRAGRPVRAPRGAAGKLPRRGATRRPPSRRARPPRRADPGGRAAARPPNRQSAPSSARSSADAGPSSTSGSRATNRSSPTTGRNTTSSLRRSRRARWRGSSGSTATASSSPKPP